MLSSGYLLRIVLLLTGALSLWCQAPTATLVGSVLDSSGAVVPQASIRVTRAGLTEERITRTDGRGEFILPNLSPGRYDVIVEKTGFQRLVESAIDLQIDQTARMQFVLKVGETRETVEVHAQAPLLNTENATKGDVIVNRELVEMPLDGRNFADLAFLVPGVQARAQDAGQGSPFNVNGARADNTNFVVDGFQNVNTRSGSVQAYPSLEAMQEFKMQTSGYSAEFGRLSGGVMNMALKTGANRLHGSLFEFLRNDILDARNFFDSGKSKLRRNQFGAQTSGPVFLPRLYDGRNRTFFLFSWESNRQIAGLTRLMRVPTAEQRAGDFSTTLGADGKPVLLRDPLAPGTCTAANQGGCFAGGRIPASRIHPLAHTLLAYFPLPNRPGQINNYATNANSTVSGDNVLYKVDQRFSQKDSLSFRHLMRWTNQFDPFTGSDLGTFGRFNNELDTLMGASETHMFTPALLNEFRFGFTRTNMRLIAPNTGHDYNREFGIFSPEPIAAGFPRFVVTNYPTLGDYYTLPQSIVINGYAWGDTVTWVKSGHLIKAGGEISRNQYFEPSLANMRGSMNFLGRWTNDPLADFLVGYLQNATRQSGSVSPYLFGTSYGAFVEDSIRVSSRLTVNLGLRYEILKPLTEKYGRWASFVPEIGKIVVADDANVPNLQGQIKDMNLTASVGLARDFGLPRSLAYTRYNDLAPRFGFALRPFGDTRTVVRGGYGIFFGGNMAASFRTDLAVVFPFVANQTFNRSNTNPLDLTLSNPFPDGKGAVSAVTNAFGYELHAPTPNLQSWSLTAEREIAGSLALEVGYVGSKGDHLGRRYDLNQPFRIPAMRPGGTGAFPRYWPQFNSVLYYAFGSGSSYNVGTITLRKRFARGVFYRLNYTYGKSLDDASQITNAGAGGYAGAQDSRNLRLERGRSDFDSGHILTGSFSWPAPWKRSIWLRGWQLAGTGSLATGQPITPQTSNVQLDLGEANRPDRMAKGYLRSRSPERWFDISAFPLVPTGAFRFGNSGRNILDGPGKASMNLSLSRRFQVREGHTLQARWEVFNLINHTNFNLPVVYVNAPNSGTITSAAAARVMQFGLRYEY